MCDVIITDTRRRTQRSNEENIPLKSFVQPRTPRGIPLLLSPIGQTHDRHIGAIHGVGRVTDPLSSANVPYFIAENLELPKELVDVEDIQVKKCALMSAVRNGTNKVKLLRVTNAEWQKLADQSESAIAKARASYDATVAASYSEAQSIYQRLVDTGLHVEPTVPEPSSTTEMEPPTASTAPKKIAVLKKGTKKR